MRVDVDQAGEKPGARAFDDADAVSRRRAPAAASRPTRVILPALDDHVHLGVERARWIDGAYAAEDEDVDHDAPTPPIASPRDVVDP